MDEECYHEDYEADINGRATCCRCGEVFYLTRAEIEAERRQNAAYERYCRREERRERIERAVSLLAFWRRWRKPAPIDDEIPF